MAKLRKKGTEPTQSTQKSNEVELKPYEIELKSHEVVFCSENISINSPAADSLSSTPQRLAPIFQTPASGVSFASSSHTVKPLLSHSPNSPSSTDYAEMSNLISEIQNIEQSQPAKRDFSNDQQIPVAGFIISSQACFGERAQKKIRLLAPSIPNALSLQSPMRYNLEIPHIFIDSGDLRMPPIHGSEEDFKAVLTSISNCLQLDNLQTIDEIEGLKTGKLCLYINKLSFQNKEALVDLLDHSGRISGAFHRAIFERITLQSGMIIVAENVNYFHSSRCLSFMAI